MTAIADKRVRYVLVGGYNTAFGYGVFVGLYALFGDDVHYLVVAVIANVVSVLNAFVAYRLFVFKVHGNVLGDLARFSSVYVVALVLNLVLLPVAVEVVDLGPLVAQAIVIGLTVVASYVGHNNFSFRRPAEVVSS